MLHGRGPDALEGARDGEVSPTAETRMTERRRRYAERQPPDSELLDRQFGRQRVLHLLFAQSVGTLWSLPPFTDTLKKFSDVTFETTADVEAGLRRVLQEVWP